MEQDEIKKIVEKKLSKLKPSTITAAIIIAVALFFVWQSTSFLGKNYELEKQVQWGILENEMQEIENETMELQQAYYKTDEYLELSAREKMNKALPGENLVILPENSEPEKADTGEAKYVDERSNFEKWVEFFLAAKR